MGLRNVENHLMQSDHICVYKHILIILNNSQKFPHVLPVCFGFPLFLSGETGKNFEKFTPTNLDGKAYSFIIGINVNIY